VADIVNSVRSNHTGTGVSGELNLRRTRSNEFTVSLRGTYTGLTVELQAKRPDEAAGSYAVIETLVSSSADPFFKNGMLVGPWDVRANITAIASGRVDLDIQN
jgi:hypothetical protein